MSKPAFTFRKQTSFNSSDTKLVASNDGRITVRNGVKRRCDLVLSSLLRFGKEGGKLSEVHADLSRFKGYSAGDLGYAIKRLATFGLVAVEGRRWYATKGAKALWASAAKEWC